MKTSYETFRSVGMVVALAVSIPRVILAGELYPTNSGSPRNSAVPGEYFFNKGVEAVRKNDYRHAVAMYKIAASWAYKAAEYNLGVIFAKGENVPEDRPQGLAWLTLAAERKNKEYVAARDLVKSRLTAQELAQADAVLAYLYPTYSDEHALPRAKLRWKEVRNQATGSHLGFVGNVQVSDSLAKPYKLPSGAGSTPTGQFSASEMTGGEGTDGSIAYRELRETDNPYDPKFDVGTVTVGDVTTVGAKPSSVPEKSEPPVQH